MRGIGSENVASIGRKVLTTVEDRRHDTMGVLVLSTGASNQR